MTAKDTADRAAEAIDFTMMHATHDAPAQRRHAGYPAKDPCHRRSQLRSVAPQVVVDQTDRGRALTNRSRHPLHRPAADVAGREDPRQAGL